MILDFCEECEEYFGEWEKYCLLIESEPTTQHFNELFRVVHNLKGSASFCHLEGLVGFAHHVENLLDLLRKGTLESNKEIEDILLISENVIEEYIRGVRAGALAFEPQLDLERKIKRYLSKEQTQTAWSAGDIVFADELTLIMIMKIPFHRLHQRTTKPQMIVLMERKLIYLKSSTSNLKEKTEKECTH